MGDLAVLDIWWLGGVRIRIMIFGWVGDLVGLVIWLDWRFGGFWLCNLGLEHWLDLAWLGWRCEWFWRVGLVGDYVVLMV